MMKSNPPEINVFALMYLIFVHVLSNGAEFFLLGPGRTTMTYPGHLLADALFYALTFVVCSLCGRTLLRR